MINRICLGFLIIGFSSCKDEGDEPPKDVLQVNYAKVGTYTLNLSDQNQNTEVPFDQQVIVSFSAPLDIDLVDDNVILKIKDGDEVQLQFTYLDNGKTFSASPVGGLAPNSVYELFMSDGLKGESGEIFPGFTIQFKTKPETMSITSLKMGSAEVLNASQISNVAQNATIEITFSKAINPDFVNSTYFRIYRQAIVPVSFSVQNGNTKVVITPNTELTHLSRHQIWISGEIRGANQEYFNFYSKYFYTAVDPTPKFPIISDDELLTLVQFQTFKYFYDFAHPASGMARERNSSGDVVTIGGSGFGVMALIVGMERGFITRADGLARLNSILNFLETCDRFHGAWPHWLNGNTGKIVPFSPTDNGGDLVETSFMIQGLITMRQYLDPDITEENELIARINALADAVEYDWFTNSENVLYWLWSPNNGYILKIQGHNETLITYFLAAASSTHSIPVEAYTIGYSRNGAMVNGNSFYGITLPLGENFGGPLFFAHYSFLGLNPTNLSDQFANYWTQNTNHSLINQAYCKANPKNFVGYSDECWGLTASDNQNGYSAHSPTNDIGVITPTAAISSMPYTPEESMKALKFFYYTLGDRLWGPYGFYDAFNITAGWTASSYLAIDQGPIIVMIENFRTGLLWDLFMSAPEVQDAASKLNFNY